MRVEFREHCDFFNSAFEHCPYSSSRVLPAMWLLNIWMHLEGDKGGGDSATEHCPYSSFRVLPAMWLLNIWMHLEGDGGGGGGLFLINSIHMRVG